MVGGKLGFDRGAFCFPVAQWFDHIRHMRPMIDSLKKANKADFVMKVWQNNLAEVFEKRIAQIRVGAAAEVPVEIMAQQLAGTLITLLTWWNDHHHPHSSAEMEQQWNSLVKGLR